MAGRTAAVGRRRGQRRDVEQRWRVCVGKNEFEVSTMRHAGRPSALVRNYEKTSIALGIFVS
jgi:hypothetical protein